MPTTRETTEQIVSVAKLMATFLAGHPVEFQGAVLADLLATWLAGHQIAGDEDETRRLRAELLAMHCTMVRLLVPINARMLGTTP